MRSGRSPASRNGGLPSTDAAGIDQFHGVGCTQALSHCLMIYRKSSRLATSRGRGLVPAERSGKSDIKRRYGDHDWTLVTTQESLPLYNSLPALPPRPESLAPLLTLRAPRRRTMSPYTSAMPLPVLTLALASPSFLDTLLTESGTPVFALETTGNRTTLSKCDYAAGLTELPAYIDWPTSSSAPVSGSKKPKGPVATMQVDGLTTSTWYAGQYVHLLLSVAVR